MQTETKTFKDYLISNHACRPAIDWVGDKTLEESWNTCKNPEWMIWLCEKSDIDQLTYVKIAVFSAKLVLPIWQEKYPNDNRPELAIIAAENYLKNPSEDAVYAAAAYAAAYDAYYATHAADVVRFKICNYIREIVSIELIKII